MGPSHQESAVFYIKRQVCCLYIGEERLPEEPSPSSLVLHTTIILQTAYQTGHSQVLSRPSGKLVLVCSLRKEKRKGKQGSRVQAGVELGHPARCEPRPPRPSVFILWSEKRIGWWVFNTGRVWWGGIAHTPHSPCTGTRLYTVSQTGSSLIKVASALVVARNLPLPCSTHR